MVGLNTLTGAAKALITLATNRLPEELRPHTRGLITVLAAQV